jgi:hypothetical protein
MVPVEDGVFVARTSTDRGAWVGDICRAVAPMFEGSVASMSGIPHP